MQTATGQCPMHVVAIDCCEHITAELSNISPSRLSSVASGSKTYLEAMKGDEVDLIIIGVSQYPIRRLFISSLRRIYPNVPLLILRREAECPAGGVGSIRGEFMLSDEERGTDLNTVSILRGLFPLKTCVHMHKGHNYDMVREVVRVITEKYPDPGLDLLTVARALMISPARLSRMLNQQVGVSFRHLLRHTRIEEAKRMLASQQYSVKEVAAQVGFSDSHYFARSFKALTGLSASEYKYRDPVFT